MLDIDSSSDSEGSGPECQAVDVEEDVHQLVRERLDWRHIVLIAWTGLRGAVGLALALALVTDVAVARDLSHRILFHVSGLVLGTLVINGISTQVCIQLLGVNKEFWLYSCKRAVGYRTWDGPEPTEKEVDQVVATETVFWELSSNFRGTQAFW